MDHHKLLSLATPDMTYDVETLANVVRVTRKAARIIHHWADRQRVREVLLDVALEIAPCTGFSTTLSLTDFICNGGTQRLKPYHRHLNTKQAKILYKWENHLRCEELLIERELFRRSKDATIGSFAVADLFPDLASWQNTPEGQLAAEFDLVDMHFLWIRCAPDDLWMLMLRRHRNDRIVTREQRQELAVLGVVVHSIQQYWYTELLQLFSPTQCAVIYHLWHHGIGSGSENAGALHRAVDTYNKDLRNIRDILSEHLDRPVRTAAGIVPALNQLMARYMH